MGRSFFGSYFVQALCGANANVVNFRRFMDNLQYCFIKKILDGAGRSCRSRAEAFAPSNIALCKYWGKRDAVLNLPLNSSLSVSLGDLGTKTALSLCSDGEDVFLLNGAMIDRESGFARRLAGYLDLFRDRFDGAGFLMESVNTVPTAAGLASSASGYAALVCALNRLGGWQLDDRRLSMLARLGSGSAARSIFNGFSVWHAGVQADGMDSFAERIDTVWPDLRLGVLELCGGQKAVGSRDGMNRTVATSYLYKSWPAQAAADFESIQRAVEGRDFGLLGRSAEHNALSMHATMMSAWPSLIYLQGETLGVIQRVQALRLEGLDLYLTMDAGPNVKLLYLERDGEAVKGAFPRVQEITPFREVADA
jgi:diphosphomevalonate decarboxylase